MKRIRRGASILYAFISSLQSERLLWETVHFQGMCFFSKLVLVFILLPHREPNGYRSAPGGSMMPNTMRQQGMGGPNPNAQMNTGGGMGMGGMNRGFGMNEQGHMGPMGGGSMYGGNGGGGSGGGGMGNRMMQMNQMNQMGHMNQMGPMNHPGQGMPQHQQQPPFQSSGGFGLSGMNSPSGSPRMGVPQQGLLMSPRNRGSPKMGSNQFSPGGKSVSVKCSAYFNLLNSLLNPVNV